MAEPTDEQLREYAAKLPQIYKDILAAFQRVSPNRWHGDALRIEAIRDGLPGSEFDTQRPSLRAIAVAIDNMQDAEILDDNGFTAYFPTDVGERLIAALTGRESPKPLIPPLPVPTW